MICVWVVIFLGYK